MRWASRFPPMKLGPGHRCVLAVGHQPWTAGPKPAHVLRRPGRGRAGPQVPEPDRPALALLTKPNITPTNLIEPLRLRS